MGDLFYTIKKLSVRKKKIKTDSKSSIIHIEKIYELSDMVVLVFLSFIMQLQWKLP